MPVCCRCSSHSLSLLQLSSAQLFVAAAIALAARDDVTPAADLRHFNLFAALCSCCCVSFVSLPVLVACCYWRAFVIFYSLSPFEPLPWPLASAWSIHILLPVCLSVCLLLLETAPTIILLSSAVQLLVFCKIDSYGNPTVPGLLSLAGQMKMGRGLLMAVGLLEGDMVEVIAALSVSAPTPPQPTHKREECAVLFSSFSLRFVELLLFTGTKNICKLLARSGVEH